MDLTEFAELEESSDAAVLCVDWDEEMKGLAGFIDDHCIGLLGERQALQATTRDVIHCNPPAEPAASKFLSSFVYSVRVN